jgi:formamidopyrimidine-DNA glycosylase
VPELPEVEALVGFLRENAVGRILTRADLASVQAIKTFDPPLSALGGLEITGVGRHGKFLDLDVSGVHLVVHLARAGWLHWRTGLTGTASISPSRAPARGSRSTWSARRRRCRGSRASVPTP